MAEKTHFRMLFFLFVIAIFGVALFWIFYSFIFNANTGNIPEEKINETFTPGVGSYDKALCKAFENNDISYCSALNESKDDCIIKSKMFVSLAKNDRGICNDLASVNDFGFNLCTAIHDKDTSFCENAVYFSNINKKNICLNIVDNAKEWFLSKDVRFVGLFSDEKSGSRHNDVITSILTEENPCKDLE